jgi:hypothetical protein
LAATTILGVFREIFPVDVGAGEGVVEYRRLEDGRSVPLNDLPLLSDLLLVAVKEDEMKER